MIRLIRKRKCKHCKVFFVPDRRHVGRQQYCAQPRCRQASKAASQRRWLHKPANRDYFCGPAHVERVRQWRQAHPGYGRRQPPQLSPSAEALQDSFTPQALESQAVDPHMDQEVLQDSFFTQPTVLIGLLAHLTGLSLQDDIARTARRLQQLGHDILHRSSLDRGGSHDVQTPHLVGQTPHRAQAVQLGGPTSGP